MKKKPSKKSKPQTDAQFERENYLHNRNTRLEDFYACLKEVQQNESSMPGKIGGIDLKQASQLSVFRAIKEQTTYIQTATKYKLPYVKVAEEKVILNDMVKAAKKVFGKEYKTLYDT